MSKPNPFSADEAKDKIQVILNDGTVELSFHCRRESMPKRGVTMLDVVNALKLGEIRRAPEWDDVYSNWKYRVEGEDIDGDDLIAITLIIESDLTLYVVTVFLMEQPTMKCEMCKGETIIKSGQRYHYTECGLDNVYLEGVDLRVCEVCGEASPRIPRINDLHATIGQAVALQNQPLSGKEARWLRHHLGLKAKEWAAYLHIDTATLSRWENGGQTIGPQADSLMRLMYFYLLAEKQGRAIPAHVADQVAAIVMQRSDAMTLLVNPHKPARYSFRLESELAYA